MFKPIRKLFSSKTTNHSLFKNLLFTFKEEIVVGMAITIIYACLNLLVPIFIRSFLTFMRGGGKQNRSGVQPTSYFTEQFIALQVLRIIFGEHAKRLFNELAIKVESTLSKRLVEKSLRMARECTDRFPQSQIYQLQNVDLRLIFTLFKNMYLAFEAPFTVLAALGLIFYESPSYGLIAIYWFLIAFLLQRELDGKMMHCNLTKLGLIDRRSKINYEMMKKVREAKLAGCEGLFVERNNNLFIEQNHDHEQYYHYATLYDITLLLLPMMVVVSVSLLDINEANPISVEEVYVLLSILQICYNPMKNLRLLLISFHDGMHSLTRLTTYFSLPDELSSVLLNKGEVGEMLIKNNTISAYPHTSYDFCLKITFQVELKKSQRLTVIGKKGQGSSSLIHMLVGHMKKVKGGVFMGGKVAYLPEKPHFSSATVYQNIAFFNKDVTQQKVRQVYDRLGLNEDIKLVDGLCLEMNDEAFLSAAQLQKIALGRVFCANADIYILDNPFSHLSSESCAIVESMLREKQLEGKTVIMALKIIEFAEPLDYILILDEGVSVEYGLFQDLGRDPHSKIVKFMKNKEQDRLEKQQKKQLKKRVIDQFQTKVHRAISFNRILEKLATSQNDDTDTQKNISQDTQKKKENLHRSIVHKQKELKNIRKESSEFVKYLGMFLRAAAPSETIYVYLIIVAAELLHIFIHFFIGHQYEEHQNNDLASFRNLLFLELILTLGLAGIIYLEGEVSSSLAVIKGNTLYSESLKRLTERSLFWFSEQFPIKIADKFNHDYEEIFVAWHNILAIYKNVIILLATIMFVGGNKKNIVIATVFIATLYFSILLFLRIVESRVVRHYYDYKYQFVRIFEESIQGAEIIKIFQVKDEFIKKAKLKYLHLASYKLAQSYTSYGEELLCDLVSIILLAIALEYGFEMKVHGRSTAVVATTIFLLMNLSEVLKNIVKLTVNLESYFSLNIEPFMELAIQNPLDSETVSLKRPLAVLQKSSQLQSQALFGETKEAQHLEKDCSVIFRGVIFDLHGSRRINELQQNPLTLQIPEGDKVLLLEKNDNAREYIVFALTRNLPQFRRRCLPNEGTIEIGGKQINDFTVEELRKTIGVITEQNFFFNGTLRANLSWGVPHFDDFQADLFAKELQLDRDLGNYEDQGLESKIEAVEGNLNSELNKKLALLRILCLKPKIVLIKDTPSFIGEHSIVKIIENHIPNVTIIKISDKIEVSFDMERIVSMKNLKILEQGMKNHFKHIPNSHVGKLLRDSNIDGYLYSNMACVSPRKYKAKPTIMTE